MIIWNEKVVKKNQGILNRTDKEAKVQGILVTWPKTPSKGVENQDTPAECLLLCTAPRTAREGRLHTVGPAYRPMHYTVVCSQRLPSPYRGISYLYWHQVQLCNFPFFLGELISLKVKFLF